MSFDYATDIGNNKLIAQVDKSEDNIEITETNKREEMHIAFYIHR